MRPENLIVPKSTSEYLLEDAAYFLCTSILRGFSNHHIEFSEKRYQS
jgi:hypothetical protein